MAKNDPHYRIVVAAPNERAASDALDGWLHPDGDPVFFRVTSWFRLRQWSAAVGEWRLGVGLYDEYFCVVTSADEGTDCLRSLQQWAATADSHRAPFDPGTLLYFTESRLEG